MSLHIVYRGPHDDTPTPQLLERLELPRTTGIVAVDTETISLKDRTCIGIGLYIAENEGFYIQVLPETSPLVPQVLQLLADPRITKIYHNSTYDLDVLGTLAHEYKLPTPDDTNIHDTMLMAHVQGMPNDLFSLGYDLLGYRNLYEIGLLLKLHNAKTMLEIPLEDTARKCLNDCRITFNILSKLQNFPNANNAACYEVKRQLIPVLSKMAKDGIALDSERLEQHYSRYSQELLTYSDICRQMGFNPASPKQVGMVLAGRGNILPLNGKQYVTDEDTLSLLDDSLAYVILEYRGISKLLSTYIRPFRNTDRAYTHFRQDLSTGRCASARVDTHYNHVCRNLQNIPPDMRDIFIPDKGTWTNLDFSQLELRIFAYLSQDQAMLETYRAGGDIHTETQMILWPGSDPNDEVRRKTAKNFNFGGITYDAHPRVIAAKLRLPELTCQQYKYKWYGNHPGAYQYIQDRKASESLYAETAFGRRMLLPSAEERGLTHVQKCAINYPVQGTAADIVDRAMLMLNDTDMDLQVHDEILQDGYYDIPDMSYIHPEIYTPIEIKRGRVWH